ncbi:SEC-C metal-binding domain-containing protein [Desulfotignum phosphitoxidans]|uniref:SEC-C motif domain-containing protein n=1 Tax=Desulfotignum phosphitoxidans DSM 13687 TaxID=1286635 RepID=S0FZP4_9BACT|nr:SEC-C metal-binding domain-containing protein [Desulfotignum phosphitoxidans]EMS77447.1 hypothetical protein, SEC_C family [Desulfotignum phosphitoxidans DSM 13687]
MTKIGRNQPCPCGSGEKYKKCCLNKPKSDSLPEKKRDELDVLKGLEGENDLIDRLNELKKERENYA